jgi:hypothetical protein
MSITAEERQERLLKELEELISQLAQQTDSKTTNLQVNMEDFDKFADTREKKRWRWFIIATTSILIPVLVLGFETWERHYDRLSLVEKQTLRIESQLGLLKDQLINKHEDKEQLDELKKKSDLERDKTDKDLLDMIKKLEKELAEHDKKVKQKLP